MNKEFSIFEKFIETIPLDNNFDEVCIDINLLKSCNCKNHFNNFDDFEELQNNIAKEDYIYLLQSRFKFYEKNLSKCYNLKRNSLIFVLNNIVYKFGFLRVFK